MALTLAAKRSPLGELRSNEVASREREGSLGAGRAALTKSRSDTSELRDLVQAEMTTCALFATAKRAPGMGMRTAGVCGKSAGGLRQCSA